MGVASAKRVCVCVCVYRALVCSAGSPREVATSHKDKPHMNERARSGLKCEPLALKMEAHFYYYFHFAIDKLRGGGGGGGGGRACETLSLELHHRRACACALSGRIST